MELLKPSYYQALSERARTRGLNALAREYARIYTRARAADTNSGIPPKRDRKKITFVIDHAGWCGERLSHEVIAGLDDYDCSIVRLGDSEHLEFDSDLYVYRNVSWLCAVQLPREALKRTISLLESERVLETKYAPLFSRVAGIIPLNFALANQVKEYNPQHVYAPIPNGISTDEFVPSKHEPTEFTVGTAGNFSIPWYDDWKGYSKYIVPACKKAGVKLVWCGWRGECPQTGEHGVQIPLKEMPAFYNSLSCFVLMSKSEACSGVTFEAMSCGLPVISTKVGFHGEMCTDGRDLLFTPRSGNDQADIDALAKKLLRLKQSAKLRASLGANARAFAQNYAWSKTRTLWKQAIDFYVQKVSA